MPWDLNTPEAITVDAHHIRVVEFDDEHNLIRVTVADLAAPHGEEVRRRVLEFPIRDDVDTVLMASTWPEAYPTGEQLFGLVMTAIYLRLADLPGGIGAGELVP